MKKLERKTKNEKRRLVMQKQNARKEKNMAMYGAENGTAVVVGKTVNFNRRFIAAFLALVFVVTTLVGVNFLVRAEVDDDGFNMLEASDDSGFVTRKGLRYNENSDTYDLRMEAYATAPIATDQLKTNVPLDVIMVLNQSGSMATEDVFQGYKDSSATSFTIDEAEGMYYKDGDEYYPLSVDHTTDASYAIITDANGAVTNWTAQTAYNTQTQRGQLAYYNENSGEFETVNITKEAWYALINSDIKVYANFTQNLNSGNPWSYNALSYAESRTSPSTTHSRGDPFYAYKASDHTWHAVYATHNGRLGGFGVSLYYYTNSERGTSVNGNNWDSSITNGTITLLGGGDMAYWWSWLDLVDAPDGYDGYYRERDLYFKQGTSSSYNKMATANTVLAYPAPNSQQSETYIGNLYAKGYRLYYTKNGEKHYVSDAVYNRNDIAFDESSDGALLYVEDRISRKEALQSAANQFAEAIAAQATDNNVEHRMGVVGYADNGSVLTNPGLVVVNQNDGSDDNTVNDIVDNAIANLTQTGSNNLASGLQTAGSVFGNNLLDDGWSRKRIVVVFNDSMPSGTNAVANAQTQGAALKDTYNASVYTVGFANGTPDANYVALMKPLSSDTFRSNTGVNTPAGDSTEYYYVANDLDSLKDIFGTIAQNVETPYTSVALNNANAVLKDIISSNFKTDNIQTDVKISTGTWPSGGDLSWGNPSGTSLSASVNGSTVSVSGFDYNANYVAEGHNGQKVILTITGLKLKDKAKPEADKRIYTNDANSGIYKTGAEDLLMAKFLRPYVDDISNMAPAGGSGVPNDGVVVNKYLTPNSNGKYDLTLEAYTTVTNQTKVEKVPTDFVVVVDQSGSMSTSDMPSGYTAVSGTKTIEDVAAGSYYIKAADGNYYRVYATRDYLYRYYPANYWFTGDIVDRLGQNLGWFMGETESETTFQNQFYFREVANGNTYYRPITTTIRGVIGTYYMRFSYDSVVSGSTYQFNRDVTTYSSNGNSPWYHNLLNGNVMRSGAVWWAADQATQGLYPDDNNYTYSELATIRTGMYVNYPMYERKVGYNELRYRDINGVEHTLASTNGQTSWEFCNANGQALTTADGTTRPAYSGLYQATGTTTRLAALKNALNDFAQAVSEETDSDGKVNNKIAIVGFSSEASDTYYSNTEILTGDNLTIQNNNGTQMRNANTSDYATALVSATETDAGTVNGKVTAAINALTANGGTQPEYGLQMANSILSNRSETEYTIKYGSRQGQTVPRNQIVIFFTDGQPGDYPYSDQYAEANQVVEAAYPIKTEQGATVFSIGVFGESDGNPLTYTHARATSVDANWEYLGGWVENYRSSPYYYALRRQWRSGADGYTPTANDTIYDYMSVTSSNYPNATDYIAPGWLNNSFQGTYTDATDGVRGGSTDSTVNNHYRMASNQDTLVAAFAQAVTMMNDTISENVRLDASAILRDILKDGSFVASPSSIVSTSTVNGKMDKNGLVTFDSTATPVALTQTPTYTDGVLSSVDVKGFDYLANYINYGTGTGVDDIHYHEGKKLVVTITDVYPDGANAAPNGDVLVYSNTKDSSSHSSALIGVNNGNETKVQDFPEPAIYRHSYKLNVGDINTSATFDVSTAIVTSTGATIDLTDSDVKEDLKDVMIVFPDGTRYNYLSVGPQVFRNSKDGDTFYFENIPSGYKVKTGVTTTDDSYVYHINFDGGTSKQMNVGVEESTAFTFDNHNINIISDRSLKNVSIWEQTIGDYSVPDQVFEEVVTAQIPVSAGTNIPQQFKYDATLSNDYHGYNNDTLPKNADSYKAVFTWNGENPVDGKVTATLTAIECTKNGTTYTYPTTNGLPMKHDDRITFAMPTGTTVTVAEPETYTHDVSLYTSKDDVAPENITFETMSGTPITGEYEMTFTPVDGIEASSQTVTFEDGVVTSTSNPIDFAPYQLLSFTTDKDIGYPYLNVNGTKIPFDVETSTEGGNTTYTYIAGLKKTTTAAPITTTVEKDNVDILVVNEKGEIPITGIGDSSNHNWIIYILAALGGLAAIGAGIFLWKKRNEFVEE